jgi:hypothetical protein
MVSSSPAGAALALKASGAGRKITASGSDFPKSNYFRNAVRRLTEYQFFCLVATVFTDISA